MSVRFELDDAFSTEWQPSPATHPTGSRGGSPDAAPPGRFAAIRADALTSPEAICAQASVYLPDGFESGYPYPLLVWFHPATAAVGDVKTVMSRISRRNYIGVAFPEPQDSQTAPTPTRVRFDGDGFAAVSPSSRTSSEDALHATLCAIRCAYEFHSERIYLAGAGVCGMKAVSMLLRRPEWFAGAVCLGGRIPEDCDVRANVPVNFEELRNRRVWIGQKSEGGEPGDAAILRTVRLLYSLRIDVAARRWRGGMAPTPAVYDEINRWLMAGISSIIV